MIAVALRTRAFGGRLEKNLHTVDPDGTVRVYDAIAEYYTRCHGLPTRDCGRVYAAMARAISDDRIRAMRIEAGAAGDVDMIYVCDRAMEGHVRSRAIVCGAIV